MTAEVDWQWKIREAIERLKTRYDYIGRKTGAPFLAIVYPPDAETAVFKEWNTQVATLGNEFEVHAIDVLEITMSVLDELGGENVVQAMADPMPGANPESELGNMWLNAVTTAVRNLSVQRNDKRPVVVLERMGALFPAVGPRSVMQQLWDSTQNSLEGPVVILIPGTLVEARVYLFLGRQEELMYRGDIL